MRSLQTYANRVEEILNELGIPFVHPMQIDVNYRARRWGQCCHENGIYTMNISATLLDERNDETGLLQTLLHEYLHTCPGCLNHGQTWKRYAAIVYQKTGINIERTTSAADKGIVVDLRPVRSHEKKYYIECLKCGHVFTRERKSDLVKYPQLYHHNKCGGALRVTTYDPRQNQCITTAVANKEE